ncbi:transposase-like protein [Paraburkholderia graminis]|uniref:Mutator family transposase n=1 Tax=Paraburkholderia graminis TaxID=60548 RepID=A0ABD5C7X3_9BURK|nr:transposase-like protein [Paraburkholderia graminis]
MYFDALRLKIRDEGTVRNKAVYLALGIRADGRKEVLGLWIEQTEGAKFWLKVFNELKNRGLHDILIAVVDGLRGFPEAIEAVYPAAQIQTCIVHLIRNSLNLASWKDRKPLAAALKPVYQAGSAEAAAAALDAFAQSEWGRKFPTVAAMWQRQWEQVIPFFAYPPGGASNRLYDQRHREHAHAVAQNRQESRPLSWGSSTPSFPDTPSMRRLSAVSSYGTRCSTTPRKPDIATSIDKVL